MSKIRNITPAHLRCTIGSCPQVHIDDEYVYIVGEITKSQEGSGDGECRVKIKREFFADLPGGGVAGSLPGGGAGGGN